LIQNQINVYKIQLVKIKIYFQPFLHLLPLYKRIPKFTAMNKKIILLILCNLFIMIASAQKSADKKYTISGYVTEEKTGEKINGASIYVEELKVGTTTNIYGFYSITIPSGSYTIEYRYLGFASVEKTVNATTDTKLDVKLLQKKANDIAGVKVVGKKKAPIQQSTQTSMNSIPMAQIKSLPAIFGEVDVLKSLQLLPGVQGGTEGTAGIFVRGGGPDQNLFLLDGVPLYNVNHLGGMFSTFNADAISNIDLYKGGFPARFGGRLSSVIDVRMKEGNNKGLHGEASVGIISSKLLLEGPIVKNKGSFMISGRRTYIDALISPLIKAQTNGQSSGGYYFYDLNTKLNYKLGEKDHLYASGYFGLDKFYLKNKTTFGNSSNTTTAGIDWGNYTGVVRWNHLYTKKLFGNLSASVSNYNFHVGAGNEDIINGSSESIEANINSGIRDFAFKYDFDYLPNTKHTIKFGTSIVFHKFTPSTNSIKLTFNGAANDTAFNANIINAQELDAYIEDDYTITDKLKANIGLHVSGFKVQNNFYTGIQPRISARYLLNEDYSIKASYAKMNQFINLLAFEGIGLPSDLWVPVTDRIKPQTSHQVALGVAGSPNKMIEVSVEGYYKIMQNVIDYKDGSSFILNPKSYEDIVEMGKGLAYGTEFFLQKKEGRLQGLISYGLAWTERKYPTINNGNWYYYKYDRRHDFKIAAIYKLTKGIELSGDWLFNTGNWTTLPTTTFLPTTPNINNPSQFLNYSAVNYYPGRNNYNMMNFHRMDISARFSKQRKRYERIWTIGVYNLYGRKNPFFLFEGVNKQGEKAYQQFSLFGFPLPSASLHIKF
jgi:CarboxypepD_reg-like domain/TonB-dependent Receptor Plug Domain/TonB dependent receptor